jgi:hypothetical protein
VGLALFAAWIGESLLNKDFKKAIFRLAISLIPILCWQMYVYRIESDSQYLTPAYEYQRADYMYPNVSYIRNTSLVDSFAPEKGYITPLGRIKRFTGNIIRMPVKLGESLSTNEGYWSMSLSQLSNSIMLPLSDKIRSWLIFFALLIFGLMVIAGIILQLIKREWFVFFYVSTYLAMMCSTPWIGQFGRYLMPMMPFLILLLFETLSFTNIKSYKFLSGRWKVTGQMFTTSVLFTILLLEAFTGYKTYSQYLVPVTYNDKNGRKIEYKLFYYHQSDQNLDKGLDWLIREAASGDVVAGSWPHLIYLRTGLKAVLPPFEPNAEKAQDLLDTVPVKYLLLEKNEILETERYILPIIVNGQNRWKLVFSTTDGELEIYERVTK